jgi:PhnB protein
MLVQPYLMFNGRCEEAIQFYTAAVGAKVEMLMRFKDCPDPIPAGMLPPNSENKVMHSTLRIGDTVVMASDGHCKGDGKFAGFSLSLSAPNDAEAERLFAALSAGGKVTMPMSATFYASRFGMLVDRFGVDWMVIVPKQM